MVVNLTRRALLKGIGALAAKAAMPKVATKLLPNVQKELPLKDAVPWVKTMTNMLKDVVDTNVKNPYITGLSKKLPNGTEISYLKSPQNQYQPHTLSIKTADGNEDLINFKETKNDIDIEFDIRDDFANNQHIYVNKKAGTTELVDDNYYMTSPEDFAKDDPIIWDIDKSTIRESMILDKTTKPDDYMYDYMSVPDDTNYSWLWERYIDSFSPAGNIFKTKQLAQAEKTKKLAQKEADELDWEEQFRRGSLHGFNKGGFVDYGKMKDVVPPLDGYAAGGVGKIIIKKAPQVINKLREWAPQITGKVGKEKFKAVKSGDTYWTVFDEAGLPIKDFKTEKAARDFLRKDPTTDMYKVGKSTDKTTKTKTEDSPAMFFRSREEIIQGPPIMSGQQWMQFLKKRGVRDAEMMDTSLGPWLSANTTNKISKNDLINKFDEIVPDFDVQVTGRDFRDALNISRSLKSVDPSVFSPEAGKIIRFLQAQTDNITDDKAGLAALKKLDDLFENAYGIKNVTKEGIPMDNVSVPYEIKQVMTDVLGKTRQRGVGMEGSAFVGSPSHGSSQVFGSTSGKNYREFLFGWKPKGPRKNEPKYDYAHSFGGAKGENAFMHARVSDRVDEYGNKLLFVEEFQSDMHQPISSAIRAADKAGKKVGKEGKYFPRLDVAVAKSNQANLEQMANIQRQIDRLLETNPRSPKLAKLYEQKDMIRGIEADKASNLGKNTSNIPEGPFKDSQDYMEFAIKYLMRVAKDGNYDGVAFSTPPIKNLNLSPGSRDYRGNLTAYGPILKNAIKKAKSKSGADLVETSIAGPKRETGRYGQDQSYFGVPALMLKGNKKALEKISKGLPAYKEGGLTKTIAPEKGPSPYGIMKDVVPGL